MFQRLSKVSNLLKIQFKSHWKYVSKKTLFSHHSGLGWYWVLRSWWQISALKCQNKGNRTSLPRWQRHYRRTVAIFQQRRTCILELWGLWDMFRSQVPKSHPIPLKKTPTNLCLFIALKSNQILLGSLCRYQSVAARALRNTGSLPFY